MSLYTSSSSSSPPSYPAAAVQRVIATPELLEAILLHLDLQTLLVQAQRVSHYFRRLITTSVALQKTLFFIPEIDEDGNEGRHGSGTKIDHSMSTMPWRKRTRTRLNPLLTGPFRIWFPPPVEVDEDDDDDDNGEDQDDYDRHDEPYPYAYPPVPPPPTAIPPHQQNNVLPLPQVPPPPPPPPQPPQPRQRRDRLAPHERSDAIIVHHSIRSFLSLGIFADHARRRAVMRPEASWRRMLVQQPAARSLGWLSWGLDFSPAEAAVVSILMKGVLAFPRGLTMGELYDVTQDRVARFPRDHVSYTFRIVRAELPRAGGSIFTLPGEEEAGEEEEEEEEEERGGGEGNDHDNTQYTETEDNDSWWRDQDETNRLMREMSVDIVYEEMGYYPTRVLGRSVEDACLARGGGGGGGGGIVGAEYRHPARQSINVNLERDTRR